MGAECSGKVVELWLQMRTRRGEDDRSNKKCQIKEGCDNKIASFGGRVKRKQEYKENQRM